MAVCDICNAPGMGTLISAEQMKKAVFSQGFNPFSLGLVNMAMYAAIGDPRIAFAGENQAYQAWKATTVAQDYSDWNICEKCMSHLQRYMDEAPKPAGVASAQVSANPIDAAIAAARAEEKYGQGSASAGSHNKALSQAESKKKEEGCFIATACYHDYDAPEVMILRRFRDETMFTSKIGRCLISVYYFISPSLAGWIEKRPLIRNLVRQLLVQPIVGLVTKSHD